MSQIWIEKLRNARHQQERDEILLRDFREMEKIVSARTARQSDLTLIVEEQIRALAALAFSRD